MTTEPKDDIRPRGTVQVQCSKCEWDFWLDPLDPQLPDGPFVCFTCEHGPKAVLMKG